MSTLLTYADATKDLTFTVGYAYTINPVLDAGFTIYRFDSYAQRSSWDASNNTYNISDPEAFSIIPIECSTGYNTYYSYQITPRKAGIYTFSQYVFESSGGHASTITYGITVVDVTSINIPSSLSCHVGDNYTFVPTITDSRASTTLTWQSSNPSVASITNGTMTVNALGSTIITCFAHNGVSATCTVTVEPIKVSGITLNKTEAELTVDEKLQLEATIAPGNATDNSITWSSSNQQ